MAATVVAPAEYRLTLKSDFPAKKSLVTVEAKSTLAALVERASTLLAIESDALSRYSIRAAGLATDVLALDPTSTAAAQTLTELGIGDQFQIIFFAPPEAKPPRKKRGKAGEEEKKVTGEEAKFIGLTVGNILGKLKMAKGKTRQTMLEYCERYWAEIAKTQRRDIVSLPKAVLIDILQRDELDAKEPELFGLALEWGKNESKKAGGSGTGDDLKKILVDVLPHIRFPVFSATEMALQVTPTRLLTSEQELHVYTHIGKVAGKKVPEAKTEAKAPGKKAELPRAGGFISVARKPYGVFRAVSARFEDNTGIFYWIGTGEGKTTFTNPIEGEVGARMSTLVGTLPSLTDRNYTSGVVENSYGSDSAPWIEFEFKRYKVRPTHYFIGQEQDHYIRNWRIEGSDDGSSWTTLRDHVSDATLTTSNRWAFFELKAEKFFRRLKLQLTGASHNGSINMDVTQMEFYGYVAPAAAAS